MPTSAGQGAETCSACGSAVRKTLAAGLCIGCVVSGVAQKIAAPSGASVVKLPAGYDLVDTLGRGGMGIVHLAYQRDLARYVALKMLSPRGEETPRARERFFREARAAARLSHPGIVPIMDIGEVGEQVWYSMEYMEGGDVSGLLVARGGSLPWQEGITLVARVAEAIQHAHDSGVAHRDLKPSNILIDLQGTPKVADFGLAWLAGAGRADLTISGEILGTPAYMAPETISGAGRDTDARPADVYALGALLYHLIAGRPPFVGEHPMSIVGAIVNDRAPRLVAADGSRLPVALELIVERCL
jgi:serine/threonine protein kinase